MYTFQIMVNRKLESVVGEDQPATEGFPGPNLNNVGTQGKRFCPYISVVVENKVDS